MKAEWFGILLASPITFGLLGWRWGLVNVAVTVLLCKIIEVLVHRGFYQMKLEAIPCPCGHCNKWLVTPLFHSQDATLSKEDADELVRRWNSFWEPPDMYPHEVKQLARKLDPECWISYSGKPKEFKRRMDKRRTAALQKAGEQIRHDADVHNGLGG